LGFLKKITTAPVIRRSGGLKNIKFGGSCQEPTRNHFPTAVT
jgi:hypothetical protein